MNTNLFSTTSYVQTPYIKVTIGDYSFGCYDPKAVGNKKYPNFIKTLSISKINGQVNTYRLNLVYPITEKDDPNYFEKIFSSVSKSRKIVFSYGDLSLDNFIYKNEEAIITKVNSNFNIASSSISYDVEAVSNGVLAASGTYTFTSPGKVKPSTQIKYILQNTTYDLQSLFTGMRNMTLVEQYNLIPGNDLEVQIETKTNITVLDYLQYLVSLMTPNLTTGMNDKKNFYVMSFIDDMSGIFGGPYFKITMVSKNKQYSEAYDLYIGYPNSNFVKNFSVNNNENYSIFYDYQGDLHSQNYVTRLNAEGIEEEVYAPPLSSGNSFYKTTELEKSWWTKVSQYPISASITIKGLLRPAILMNYVRLYLSFYGKLHIHSGLYIVTKQEDSISGSGYYTTLNLTKISNDVNMEEDNK